jgi:hypothetical protein
MGKIIYLFGILLIFNFGIAQDCNQMPAHFSSYESAVNFVKNARFKFTDNVNTSKSSWIRGASYYSCDGKTGYFIFSTDEKIYIHKGIPIEIWQQFKQTNSFRSFYDHNIKGRYRFYL